jgi:uncharacterized protein YndB with AHSA1/START domain
MTKYDVSNQATIAATPAEIVGAFLAEAAGRSRWWQPSVRMRQRGSRALPELGAAVEITVTGESPLWWSARFTGRVIAFEADRRLVLEYFDGDFRGSDEWTVEPVDAGHTRVTTRWRTDPQGAVRLAARLVDIPGSYSKVMREGFRAIERFAARERPRSQA